MGSCSRRCAPESKSDSLQAPPTRHGQNFVRSNTGPGSDLAVRSGPEGVVLKTKSFPGRNIPLGTRTLATIGLALLLAGCQGTFRQAAPAPAAQSASSVCAGYGLSTGTATFDRCVAYQESRAPGPSVPPYRLDQYNNRVDAEGYPVDGTGHRMPVQGPYNLPMGQASSP
jgi:hypothetical protein